MGLMQRQRNGPVKKQLAEVGEIFIQEPNKKEAMDRAKLGIINDIFRVYTNNKTVCLLSERIPSRPLQGMRFRM